MPNAPLPWKGVLLVLIPGLIFFVSQIEQVISDKDWFFIVYYRAALFLILPVVLDLGTYQAVSSMGFDSAWPDLCNAE